MITHGIDHIALTAANLDEPADRLTSALGMVVERRFEGLALIADPASGVKIELSRSDDSHVHLRHLGFRIEDVDSAYEGLVKAGMEPSEAAHRRDFAAYTPRSSSSRAASKSSL